MPTPPRESCIIEVSRAHTNDPQGTGTYLQIAHATAGLVRVMTPWGPIHLRVTQFFSDGQHWSARLERVPLPILASQRD